MRRLETAYDGQGNAYLLTSYDASSGGNVVNQVQREFNGLGQMTKEYQSVSGAVNTGTTTISNKLSIEEVNQARKNRKLVNLPMEMPGILQPEEYPQGAGGKIKI